MKNCLTERGGKMAEFNSIFKDIFGEDIFGGFNSLYSNYENELNRLIRDDFLEYCKRLNEIKAEGYKVLRNSDNKHRVERRD